MGWKNFYNYTISLFFFLISFDSFVVNFLFSRDLLSRSIIKNIRYDYYIMFLMHVHAYRSYFSLLEFLVGSKHHLRLLITKYALKQAQKKPTENRLVNQKKRITINIIIHACWLHLQLLCSVVVCSIWDSISTLTSVEMCVLIKALKVPMFYFFTPCNALIYRFLIVVVKGVVLFR